MIPAAGEQPHLGDPVLAGTGLRQPLLGKRHRAAKLLVPFTRLGPALQSGKAALHLGRIVCLFGSQGGDALAKHLHRHRRLFQSLQRQLQLVPSQWRRLGQGNPQQQTTSHQDLHADIFSSSLAGRRAHRCHHIPTDSGRTAARGWENASYRTRASPIPFFTEGESASTIYAFEQGKG